ncbi:hypothetical protein ACFPRL_17190 [Pseudoclavibacter helvolus]
MKASICRAHCAQSVEELPCQGRVPVPSQAVDHHVHKRIARIDKDVTGDPRDLAVRQCSEAS